MIRKPLQRDLQHAVIRRLTPALKIEMCERDSRQLAELCPGLTLSRLRKSLPKVPCDD